MKSVLQRIVITKPGSGDTETYDLSSAHDDHERLDLVNRAWIVADIKGYNIHYEYREARS